MLLGQIVTWLIDWLAYQKSGYQWPKKKKEEENQQVVWLGYVSSTLDIWLHLPRARLDLFFVIFQTISLSSTVIHTASPNVDRRHSSSRKKVFSSGRVPRPSPHRKRRDTIRHGQRGSYIYLLFFWALFFFLFSPLLLRMSGHVNYISSYRVSLFLSVLVRSLAAAISRPIARKTSQLPSDVNRVSRIPRACLSR